jgi:hydrogenase maturation protein HypF
MDVRNGKPVPEVSLKLHNTVAGMIVEICRFITGDTGLKQVALSGGVFQNRLLLRLAIKQLEKAGFIVLTHHLVPTNDSGIALGQAMVASQCT